MANVRVKIHDHFNQTHFICCVVTNVLVDLEDVLVDQNVLLLIKKGSATAPAATLQRYVRLILVVGHVFLQNEVKRFVSGIWVVNYEVIGRNQTESEVLVYERSEKDRN